ncbi:MAG: cupin domain-containing protein [Bacteroidota bacterium]
MEVIKLKEQETVVNSRGVSVKHLFDRKDVAVYDVILQPGQTLPAHITPVDVFFYVIAGKGQVQIGDETVEVNATDLIISPAGIPHGLTADQENAFSVMVVKTPNPQCFRKN